MTNLHDVADRLYKTGHARSFAEAERLTIHEYGKAIDDATKGASMVGHVFGAGLMYGARAMPPLIIIPVAALSLSIAPAFRAGARWVGRMEAKDQIGDHGHHHLWPNAPATPFAAHILKKYGLVERPKEMQGPGG